MPAALYEENKGLAQKPLKELVSFGDEVIPVTEDRFCIFLKLDFTCAIYEKRPSVCINYGYTKELQCPYCKPNGNLRSPAKMRQVQRQITHQIDKMIKDLGQRIR
jgi:Fe-S-cluster containining protein